MGMPRNISPVTEASRHIGTHAGKNGGAQGLPHLGPGAGRDHQRCDAENEGKRRHQDRPQPPLGGADRRLRGRAARLLRLARELDDQDRILRCQPDEHDEADLR